MIQRQAAVAVLLNILLIGLIALFSAMTLVSARGNLFDFYPHWVGGRAVWSGQSPYTPVVTEQIQTGMFGGILTNGGDQQRFAYPAYTSLLLLPWLVIPAETAIPIWLGIQFWAVLITPFVWVLVLRWQPPPVLLVVSLIGLTIVFRYPLNLFLVGQFTGGMLLLLSLAVWLLLSKHDVLAGVVFALSTVPPTVAAPLALIILGGFALGGRWRGLIAFLVVMAGLLGASIILIGWWIPDFVGRLGEYAGYSFPVWSPSIFGSSLIAEGVLIGTALWFLGALRGFLSNPDVEHQIQYILVTFVTALILMPQTGNYYLVLLIPPLWVSIRRAHDLRGKERWIVGGLIVLAVLSPWAYYGLETWNRNLPALCLPLHLAFILSISFRLQRRQVPPSNSAVEQRPQAAPITSTLDQRSHAAPARGDDRPTTARISAVLPG